MKWLSLDESVSLCIYSLTIACNREMQPFFFFLIGYSMLGKTYFRFGSGSGSKFNCAARVGSDEIGYGPGLASILSPCRLLKQTQEVLIIQMYRHCSEQNLARQ